MKTAAINTQFVSKSNNICGDNVAGMLYDDVMSIGLTLEGSDAPKEKYLVESQTVHHLELNEKGELENVFDQFQGYVYPLRGGKLLHHRKEVKWFWGRGKDGSLYHEGEGENKRFKVWMTLKGTYIAYEIATAVHDAVTCGKNVLTHEQVEMLHGRVPMRATQTPMVEIQPTPAPSPKTTPVEMPPVTAEDETAVETDLAMLDSDKKPIDRLKDGDPSIFLTLGATPEQAEKWSAWIRENPGKINSITDVKKVRGIGRVNFTALVTAWNEKFE